MPLLCHHGRRLLLLVLLAATSNGNPTGDTYDPSDSKCQQNYTCGSVSVRYPFYLSSATEVLPEYGGSYCGYPELAIICDGGTPILKLHDDNYTVSHIDVTNHTISLVDPDVVGRSCPIVDHNVTVVLPATRMFFPPSATAYLFFFINCTFGQEVDAMPPPKPPKPPTIEPITCGASGEGPTSTKSFVLPESEVPPKDWWQGCQAVFKVPVLRDTLPDNARDPEWRKDGYVKALREGFQVAWDQIPGKCSRCEQSNGKCGYNRTGGFLGCFCANGLVDSDGCSNISDSTAPPSGKPF